ncbi:hypothetical protein PsYK624_165150 [Phanerochaete sordida]|uniref:JmjC domain-containing protein n=1 Tax=Phanerochaete sordida TaxID=48140 RepID=A0A9P3GWL6_9APHY|nr:hypothetical protein PsYK624_165150 [Phanerochaete sordida]
MTGAARTSKRKVEDVSEVRAPCADKKEFFMGPDDPYLQAALPHGCICGVWIPSMMKQAQSDWDQLPLEYVSRRPPPRKSHKKKAAPRDEVSGSLTRTLWYAAYYARLKISPELRTVGLPGDIWITATTVQVSGRTEWLDLGPDGAQNGVFRHPSLPCTLGWKPEDHRLGYGGTKKTVDLWEEAWARDALARATKGFEARIPGHCVVNALERVRELATVTAVTPGARHVVPYKDLSQEVLAALLFPLHDPTLAGPSAPAPSASLALHSQPASAATATAVTAPLAPRGGDSASTMAGSNLPPFHEPPLSPLSPPPNDIEEGLPEEAYLIWSRTGQRHVLPEFMQDPQDSDGRMARTMTQGRPGVQPLPESPHETYLRSARAPIVTMHRSDAEGQGLTDVQLARAIMDHLQVGQVVLMKGWKGPSLPWGLETFAKLSGGQTRKGNSLEVTVEWQSAIKRIECRTDERARFTTRGTFREFVEAADPCLLDPGKPKNEDRSFQAPVNLLDLAISMDITEGATFLRELGDDVKASDALKGRLNSEVFHIDGKNIKGWALVSGAGFQSFTHVDGSGLATIVRMCDGCKYWAVLQMKGGFTDASKLRSAQEKMQAAFEQYVKIAEVCNNYTQAPIDIPNLATIHFIRLEPDMILIQPPGVFHEVYTPVRSVAIGGHFMAEDLLHLTLQCRLAIARSMGQAGNAYHPDTNRTLARMLLAQIERGDTYMNRRGFISLIRMLKQADLFSGVDYVKFDTDEADPVLSDTEFEIGVAVAMAEAILTHNGLTWEDIALQVKYEQPKKCGKPKKRGKPKENETQERGTPQGPFFPGDSLPWYERGTDVVTFPEGIKDELITFVKAHSDELQDSEAQQDSEEDDGETDDREP